MAGHENGSAMTADSSLFESSGLRHHGATPLYLRVQEHIRSAIEAGRFKPRDALPGERDLAESLNVSRVTVRKALGGLIEAGLVHQIQGSGTFVTRKPARLEQGLSRLTSFTEEMRLRGLDPAVHVLRAEISLPSAQEAMHLVLSPHDHVSRLERLRLAGSVPLAIELATLPHAMLPDPSGLGSSLYACLDASGYHPVRALQRLRAGQLSAEHAALLDVVPGSAALAMERVSFLADGRPVEFTRSWYRGDAYDFVAELTLRQDA